MTYYDPRIPIDMYRNKIVYSFDPQRNQSADVPQSNAPDPSKPLSELSAAEIVAASNNPEHFANLIRQFEDLTAQ